MKQHIFPGVNIPKVKPQTQPTEVSLEALAKVVEGQGLLIEHLTRRIDHIQRNGTNKDIHFAHGGDLL